MTEAPVHTEKVVASDTRTVWLRVDGAPLLHTPSGKAPMEPSFVRLTFDIRTGEVRRINVGGLRCPDGRWHRSDHMTRRVTEGDAPLWLKELIEEWRP